MDGYQTVFAGNLAIGHHSTPSWAIIPPLAGYFGTVYIGWQIGSEAPVKLTQDSALQISILYFFAILTAFLLIAFLIQWMSATYGESRALGRCLALAVYAAVPLLLSGLAQVYPVLWLNLIVGIVAMSYAVYLLYSGVSIVMNIPQQQGFLFASAVLAVCLVVLVATMAATVILWSFGFEPKFTYMAVI